jgi:hypothetical protein
MWCNFWNASFDDGGEIIKFSDELQAENYINDNYINKKNLWVLKFKFI